MMPLGLLILKGYKINFSRDVFADFRCSGLNHGNPRAASREKYLK